jgi:hypothetical protein
MENCRGFEGKSLECGEHAEIFASLTFRDTKDML